MTQCHLDTDLFYRTGCCFHIILEQTWMWLPIKLRVHPSWNVLQPSGTVLLFQKGNRSYQNNVKKKATHWRHMRSLLKHWFLLNMTSWQILEHHMKSWSTLRKYFVISLTSITHLTMRTHSHVPFMTGCLCAIEVWFLCSLRWGRQLNPVSFLLFYSTDPPWISALTPDERHFISELLTQFHRVRFLLEGKIKKMTLFNTFW